LLPLLAPKLQDNTVYQTATLSELEPAAVDFKDRACGLLALSISRSQQIYLLWFRPELVQTIDWAGDPHKPLEVAEDGTSYISPRQSFQQWRETVYLQSAPWQPVEVAAVLELRSTIVGIVLQKADELARLNLKLIRSNNDLAAFAYVASHDLKAPLRAISNLACWLQEDLGDLIPPESQHHLDLLQSRVYRLDHPIDGLLKYARVGRQNFFVSEIDLTTLLREIVDALSPPDRIQISLPSQNLVLTHS
jgi:two-component system, chemotaxis family, sensor kinase Cph1